MRHASSPVVLLLIASSLAAQEPYGPGTAGTGSIVPTLASPQAWMGNASFGCTVQNGLGGATGLLGISTQPANLAFGGTTILIGIDPASLFALLPIVLTGPAGVPGAGSTFVPLPLTVPVDPSLAGLGFYLQALLLDQPLAGTFAATHGLRVELTMPPLVFVGTSVGGSADPHYFVDPLTLAPPIVGTSNTDNVTDAVFVNGGRDLYVSRSLGNSVMRADLSGAVPAWSTFYLSAGNGCYGLGYDRSARILYTLTNPGTGTVELVALDANVTSPTYGQVRGNTTGLSTTFGFVERWCLSRTGNLAAILTVFSNVLVLVDTNPSSATWLQVIGSSPIPQPTSPFNLPNNVVITPDDAVALVVIQAAGSVPGEVARYSIPANSWFDHDPAVPGTQNIGPSAQPPAAVPVAVHGIDLSDDARFAVISGWSGTGGLGRIDLDPSTPNSWGYAPLVPPVSLAGAWALSILGDQATVAVAVFPSPMLHLVDVQTGGLVGSVALPGASNIYTVEAR